MRQAHVFPRSLAIAAMLLGAVILAGCEQTADLIPGSATPQPTATSGVPISSATPIVVPPNGSAPGSATGGVVIPDDELTVSVVQVIALDTSAGFEQVARYGSGVVVDTQAQLIATAYSIVKPDTAAGTPAYSSIVIATDRNPEAEPQREFIAELVRADAATGVALLRVVSDIAGNPVSSFDLPAVVMGDASVAGAGFALRLFGFPEPAATTTEVATAAKGSILGQRGAADRTGRTWFKIDARLPFSSAGGPAFDRYGALVGLLAQDRYVTAAEIGQVRPVDLLTPLLEDEETGEAYEPALYRTDTLPGSLSAEPFDGIYVSRPSFAENAVDNADGRDLFDYETRFTAGLAQLYYEYEVSGAADGATIDEQWYLDGVHQDSLSSSYVWAGGTFDVVNDRITSPGAGIPTGRWRLDIYVNGVMHATATAVVGVELGQPVATFVAGGSAATTDGNISIGAFSGAAQVLAFFDVSGMDGARNVQWVVFRDNQPVYTSPDVAWQFGESGRFWVGYRPDAPITPGTWDFELRADGQILAVGSIPVF